MTLPNKVIERDQKLTAEIELKNDQLMELRWHWTLDESNSARVSFSEYAREVGLRRDTIGADARGWAEWLAANECPGSAAGKTPGKAQNPNEFRELAKMGGEKQKAVEAVARTTGRTVGAVARGSREEVSAVVSTARERAERRKTTVEAEIEEVAEHRAKAAKAAKGMAERRKSAHTMQYLKIEGDIATAMRKLRTALDEAEGVEFSADERELLADSLGKLRALLNLIEIRVTDSAEIDWDTELAKLTG